MLEPGHHRPAIGEDMSKRPSSARLTSTTRGDLETTAHASNDATNKP